jgi:hypothetical protein
MIANGELRDLDEGRELVRNSFFQERFEPTCPRIWEENYARFKRVTGLD